MGVLESIGIRIIMDVGKGAIKLVPHAIAKQRVQKFFGKSVFGDDFYIVIDPYEHPIPRSTMRIPQNRYVKKFFGRKPDGGLIGEDKVLGSCHLRTINYAISFFAKFRNPLNPIKIVFDEDVLNIWDGGFLCIGSADSNIKTYDIEKLKENNFYSLSWNENGGRCFDVRGTIYNIENNEDVGLLIKLRNPRHAEHALFLCQGLGEWGSSGAVYYLFHNFINIYKSAKGKDFCKVIRTRIGSDDSAHEIVHISEQ